jgi:tyrosine-protein kinase Etk/Wzc
MQDDQRNNSIVLKWFAEIMRSRRFVATNFVLVILAALIISLFLPKWYRASATVLPPKQPDIFGSLGAAGSVLKNLPGAIRLGGIGQKTAAYNYFAILKSRSAMEAVIRRFNLIDVYEISDSSLEKTIKELEGNVTFEETNDEYILIEVLDKDAVRAAAMANFFVETLNSISIELGTREARANRIFIGERLSQARDALARSEDSLKAFQERTSFVVTPEQSSAVSGIASLYALKTKKEIEIAVLSKGVTGDNPALKQLQVELDALDKKLITFPLKGLQSLRLYREVMIQEKIAEFLLPLYEQARIDEQKDVPVVLVLDKAVAPEKKFKPKRLTIVAVAAVLSLITSFLVVVGRTNFDRMKQLHQSEFSRIAMLWAEFRSELTSWRRLVGRS